MQVFLPFEDVLQTAEVLDYKRLNKQILECNWIINSLKTQSRVVSHPIVKCIKTTYHL